MCVAGKWVPHISQGDIGEQERVVESVEECMNPRFSGSLPPPPLAGISRPGGTFLFHRVPKDTCCCLSESERPGCFVVGCLAPGHRPAFFISNRVLEVVVPPYTPSQETSVTDSSEASSGGWSPSRRSAEHAGKLR